MGYVVIYLYSRHNKARLAISLTLFALTVLAIFYLSSHFGRFLTGLSRLEEGDDVATDLRFYIWETAFNAWMEHPILGMGSGNFAKTRANRGSTGFELCRSRYMVPCSRVLGFRGEG